MYCLKQYFADVSVIGVHDCIRTKHKTVRILWILFLILGLICTTYFMVWIIKDYMESPTTTKVYVDKTETSLSFPPTYVRISPPMGEWTDTNLSSEVLSYIRSWLVKPSGEEQNDTAYILARNELNHFAKSPVIKVKDIPLMSNKFFTNLVIQCGRCENSENVTKNGMLVEGVVTYEILFKPHSTNDEYMQKEIYELYVYNPKPDIYTVSLNFGKSYPFITTEEDLALFSNSKYIFIVNAQKMKRYESNNGCTKNIYESSEALANECWYKAVENFGNCSYVRNGTEQVDSKNYELCSTLKLNLDYDYLESETSKCIGKGLPLCEELIYSYTVMRSGDKSGQTRVVFKLSYAHNGMITFEEVPSLNFISAVSNVGGQLGLWLGMGLITVVQLFMLCLDRLLNRCTKPNKASVVVIKPIIIKQK